VLSKSGDLIASTAVAPILWGTTYFTSTTFLVADHPLLSATIRALPAGLVLLVISRRMPSGAWWWKSVVLGVLNIGGFFAFLFIAADRLPGGVAAVIGGIQPLLVSLLAARVLAERISTATLAAGIAGVSGVALIVLRADAGLDAVGVLAALAGAGCMAVRVVLSKRWGSSYPPLVTTSWQLLAGGLLLAVLTAVLEPLPDEGFTLVNVGGYAYLSLMGTALAYLLWFRGLHALPARVPAFLGLLSPMVAVTIGVGSAGEVLTGSQITGMVLVLLSVAAAVTMQTVRGGGGGGTARAPRRVDTRTKTNSPSPRTKACAPKRTAR
jgi:probable blue pigment (indigoidine) exporter